ncbi:hypothetical protein [Nostoc sp. ChiVER01]|nr:hypothetical protein [Nostoc sp. ChiVER01]MDZ8225087.1 hypothetical protein [Nostoc sp. ChiVER01]
MTRVDREICSLPLIDQKTKAVIAIAVDIVNQNHQASSNPFTKHINIALK